MIRIESLPRLRRPIVWTLHDMWAFTGGCHTPSECELFRYSCGKCPMLSSKRERDLSRTVWKRKHRAWRDLDVWIVTPSTWLAERAARAPILQDKRIVVIPNGLDTTRFKPVNKCAAREMLSVPHDRKIVLFGALNFGHDHNKGFHLLKDALEVFASSECGKHALLVLFGSSVSVDNRDAGIEVHNVGRLHDDISLSVLYAAADVTVVPSLHENLSNTIMESLGCGTPVVAFDSGGNADMIDHLKSGYLARPFSVDDLARGIEWVLSDRVRYDELCTRARDKVVKEFELTTIAKKYRDLYEAVLERKGQKERIVSL